MVSRRPTTAVDDERNFVSRAHTVDRFEHNLLTSDIMPQRTLYGCGLNTGWESNLQLNVGCGFGSLVDDSDFVPRVAANFDWIDDVINIKEDVDQMFNRQRLFCAVADVEVGKGFEFDRLIADFDWHRLKFNTGFDIAPKLCKAPKYRMVARVVSSLVVCADISQTARKSRHQFDIGCVGRPLVGDFELVSDTTF